MIPEDLKAAHKHCFKNRAEIESSADCGCFYCGRTFSAAEITDWIDDGQTALCPHCGIDAVLGSQTGLAINKELSDEMNHCWF